MKKIILPISIIVFITFSFLGIAYYQSRDGMNTKTLSFLVEEKTVEELSKESTKVVVATVEKVLPSQLTVEKVEGSYMIYTDIVLSVKETFKSKNSDQVIVRIPGGSVVEEGQKSSIIIEDMPELIVNDDVVMFLGKGTDGLFTLPDGEYYSIYGGFQGVYIVNDDKAANAQSTLELSQLKKEIKASTLN